MLNLLIIIRDIVINSLLFCVRWSLLALLIPCILVHELGHLLAALFIGIRIEAFELGEGDVVFEYSLGGISFRLYEFPIGGGLMVNSTDKTYSSWQVIVMLVAGLLANLLLALFCMLVVNHPIGWVYGVINACFVIFSVSPSWDSDGYRCYQILRGEIPEGMDKRRLD